MLKKFWWRIQFTLYGQAKCPIGIAIWWSWSDTGFDDSSDFSTPQESAQEEIFQMSADC